MISQGEGYMNRLQHRAALVTGGAQGLGRAIAVALAREGAAVGVVDIDATGAGRVADEIVASGGSALPLQADVSRADQVRDAVARVIDWYGRLDVLVNNAMWSRRDPVADVTDETLDRMIGVGLKAIFWTVQAALPHLRAVGGGSIINMASLAGETGFADTSVYSAVKAGIIGVTRSLAAELGTAGIRVNAISPGAIPTQGSQATIDAAGWEARRRRTPLGRIGAPEDVAGAAVFLASDESAFVTGEVLRVDGGWGMAGSVPST
jgi:NAD(P)-dependent dehydrogenase (short-subunit alcohol dehydrogenase family)